MLTYCKVKEQVQIQNLITIASNRFKCSHNTTFIYKVCQATS